jgi:hypothetical protein
MTLLEDKKAEIYARIEELAPLVEEYEELSEAAAALGITTNGSAPAKSKRGRPAKAGAAKPKGTGTGKRGRPPGSGNRGEEILGILRITPGLTIAEVAGKLNIKPNYLYRVLPGMEKDGKVKKVDKGYHVV